MALVLYVLDVFKGFELRKKGYKVSIMNIFKGDWRTLSMKKEEQSNFRKNLIEKGILTKFNDRKNIKIIVEDLQYLLAVVERENLKYKEKRKFYGVVLLLFGTGLWTSILVKMIEKQDNSKILNFIFIMVCGICVIRWYFDFLSLDRVRHSTKVCDELTEIKNDLIRNSKIVV